MKPQQQQQRRFIFLILPVMILIMSSSSGLAVAENPCKLKSEITLKDTGLDLSKAFINKSTGKAEGWTEDYTNVTMPCRSVGDALDAGYTMDEIRNDMIRDIPLY